MRKHLINAFVLLLLELWLGLGILGAGCGMVLVPVFLLFAITNSSQRWPSIRKAGIYAALSVLTIAVSVTNLSLAQTRATPVISAIQRFHNERGRYPNELAELVPEYLSSIPHGGFTRISRNYYYFPHEGKYPQLYFAAMIHGVYAYDFATSSWRTSE